jgi:hypothetical protein
MIFYTDTKSPCSEPDGNRFRVDTESVCFKHNIIYNFIDGKGPHTITKMPDLDPDNIAFADAVHRKDRAALEAIMLRVGIEKSVKMFEFTQHDKKCKCRSRRSSLSAIFPNGLLDISNLFLRARS